jgi:hypothetical protein
MTDMIGKHRRVSLVIAAALTSVLIAACSAEIEELPPQAAPAAEAEVGSGEAPAESPALQAEPAQTAPVRVELSSPAVETVSAPEEPPAPENPGFDPANPYRFCDGESCVDFLGPDAITVNMPFAEAEITVDPVLYDPSVSLDESLPVCDENLLVTNAKDGDSVSEVWYKVVLYAHSGNCWGAWHPAEYLRNYLEGGYLWPSDSQREERLQELQGQTLTFDQGSGPVTFQIVDIAYLDPEMVEDDYALDPGSLDRFFTTGTQEGVHEAFWIFCGSVGLARPDDPFASRYILRLQVVGQAAGERALQTGAASDSLYEPPG